MAESLLKVLISIPNMGWIHKVTAQTAIGLLQDRTARCTLNEPTAVPYENNMNQIVRRVLDGGFNFWLNLDADNAPARNPLDLLALDLDVVGCPYPSCNFAAGSKWPFFWSAFDHTGDGYAPHGFTGDGEQLQEVDAVGSGCMLVARRVLQVVNKPFCRQWDSQGIVTRGADFSFCARVKSAGFKVWCHYGYPVRHFKELDLLTLMGVAGPLAEQNGGPRTEDRG